MLSAIVTRVKRLFVILLSLFRRIICLRKRRPSQESILPITISHGKEVPVLLPVPDENTLTHYYSSQNAPAATNFNPGYSNQQLHQSPQQQQQQQQQPHQKGQINVSPTSRQFSQYSVNWNSFGSSQIASLSDPQQLLAAAQMQAQPPPDQGEEQEDIDYFKDMAPKLKQPRVYYVNKADEEIHLQERSNKFSFDPSVALLPNSTELGDLDDEQLNTCDSATAWDEELNSFEIENQIKKVREEERRRRQAEIAARKKAKEKRNPNRTLSATKIS